MPDPTSDNPLAKFFMPKEECDTVDKRKAHECGFFGLPQTESGLNLMTETACIGAGIFHKSTDDMIVKAHLNNGFQSDIPYVNNLLSLDTTDPGLESVLKAQEGGPIRTWENKISFTECFKLTQDDKFIDGLYGAIQDGSLPTNRPIYDKQHAAAEFQSKCVIDAATTSLCKLGLAARERDTHIPAENIKPTPKPTPSTPPPFIPGFGPTPKPGSPTPKPSPKKIMCVLNTGSCKDAKYSCERASLGHICTHQKPGDGQCRLCY